MEPLVFDLRYLPLFKAARFGHWKKAEEILNNDPNALNARFGDLHETLLHVAVSKGASVNFLQKLMELMPPLLREKNDTGNTALHKAANAGNIEAVKMLVQKDPQLLLLRNHDNDTPLHVAALRGREEAVRYLLQVPLPLTPGQDPNPFLETDGVRLLNYLIDADFYDIALCLLKPYPKLAFPDNIDRTDETNALVMLARKPQAFQPPILMTLLFFLGVLLSLCGIIVKKIKTNQGNDEENPVDDVENSFQESKPSGFTYKTRYKFLKFIELFELLNLLIAAALKLSSEDAQKLLVPPLQVAAETGNYVVVLWIIYAYRFALFVRDANGRNVFHLALMNGQYYMFLLLLLSGLMWDDDATSKKDAEGNNLLHLALSQPSNKILNPVAWQEDFLWFQTFKKIVPPSYMEMKNNEGKTPRELLNEKVTTFVKEGAKMMKTEAESCTIVAVLVVTLAFAAMFTVPGGNGDDGTPAFLYEKAFMIFAMADALALFSSSTSLLIFLGMYTPTISKKNFPWSWLKMSSIGHVFLYFSIATMLVAFTASTYLVLFHRVKWIAVPIVLLALPSLVLFCYNLLSDFLDVLSIFFAASFLSDN